MTTAAAAARARAFPSFSTVNFYAGSKLNRLSWLRTSTEFLNETITSPNARFLPLKHLDPLVHTDGGQLASLSWNDVKQTILECVRLSGGQGDKVFGPDVYSIKPDTPDTDKKKFSRATDGVGPHNLALVFLGLDESHLTSTSLPGQMANDSDSSHSHSPTGTPYFALSLTYTPPGSNHPPPPVSELLEHLEQGGKYDFIDLRTSPHAGTWPMHDAAIVAQAKSLLDWNERHQFCPACSRRQYSLWAGYKRGCSSSLGLASPGSSYVRPFLGERNETFDEDGKGECPSTLSLSNFHYPRTDPVIIMAIISSDGEKVLLGRQKNWPNRFVSCLAGFCEPGESFEEAVRREVLEEAGVKVNQVVYHSSQPWPYPSNLMAGFFGIAEDNSTIRLDLDNELEHARFYTRAEILNVLDYKPGNTKDEPPSLRLPPETAIARILVTAWARGEAVLPNHVAPKTKM